MAAFARRAVCTLSSGALAVTCGVAFSAGGDESSAFVFIKPHANTAAAQELVKKTLTAKGLSITAEGTITSEQIDKGMLIDQHYYAIASKVRVCGASLPTSMATPPEQKS